MIQELKSSFGTVFELPLINEIAQSGTFKEVPVAHKLIEIGDYIRFMPLLLEGTIKILREDSEGDELLLYYLEQGDTCSMTMSCCLGNSKSGIRAIAETNSKLICIPMHKMEEWTGSYKTWRNFVFKSYHNRLNELMATLDSIAFMKMDERLLEYLQRKIEINGTQLIFNTHQQIAHDLHTSRVVISRLLKKLENLGKLKIHRGHIELL